MITKQELDRAKSIRLINPELGNPIYYRVAIGWKNPSSSLNDYKTKEVIETAAAWEVHEWEDQPGPETLAGPEPQPEADYQTQIDELKEQLHRYKAKMADCKKGVMAMYNSISDCEAKINELSGRISKLENTEAEPPRLKWGKIPEDVLQKWGKMISLNGSNSEISHSEEDMFGVNFYSKAGEALLIMPTGRSLSFNESRRVEVEWPIVRLIDQMRADGLEFNTGGTK